MESSFFKFTTLSYEYDIDVGFEGSAVTKIYISMLFHLRNI